MPHDQNQKLPPMLNLEQFYIEQYLLDAAERRRDLIEVRWQSRATSIRPDGAGATVGVSTPLGAYTTQTDWLIACDGGRSRVREALGLQLRGASYEGRYLVADIEIKSDRPTGRLAWFDPPSNPGSTILVHIQPDDVWRIDYQLGDDEDSEEAVRPENVIPRVARHLAMMGESADWSPIWITLYKAHALSLDQYRHGRVLFAGDAAHLTPIFGVRGANSGIDDADNLAWKLAYVATGRAGEGLLDSYSTERVAAARENLGQGMKSTEFMAPPTFAFSLMRDAVLGLAEEHVTLRSLINPRQSSPISYDASPLNVADEGFAAGPPPGAPAAECPLTLEIDGAVREAFLTELIGPRFTGLYFADGAPDTARVAALRAVADILPVPFALMVLSRRQPAGTAGCAAWDHTGRLFDLYDARPGSLYLLRPDGHVLGRWRDPDPAVVTAAMKRVLGQGGQAS
jgi:3-(3-hydroxy-phenyl)propionate hydroxylase